jgi:hypothetical protein
VLDLLGSGVLQSSILLGRPSVQVVM